MQILNDILNFPFILAQQEPQGSPFSGILIIALMFAAMWFLIIAPQRKRQKQQQQMIQQLKSGDQVLTNGGIYGVITNVKEDRFVIKISDNTKIEVNKSFIQTSVSGAMSDSTPKA